MKWLWYDKRWVFGLWRHVVPLFDLLCFGSSLRIEFRAELSRAEQSERDGGQYTLPGGRGEGERGGGGRRVGAREAKTWKLFSYVFIKFVSSLHRYSEEGGTCWLSSELLVVL